MSIAKKRPYTILPDNFQAGCGLESEANPWALKSIGFERALAPMPARLVLVFPSGDSLGIPMTMVEELQAATPSELSMLELSPAGDTIISKAVDAHISVAGLVRDYAERQASFMERVVKLSSGAMGRRKSARKSLAAAENGKKGGRPRNSDQAAPTEDSLHATHR